MSLSAILLEAVATSFGFGRHGYYVSPQHQITIMKHTLIGSVLAMLGQLLIKSSICLLLLRLLGSAVARRRKLFLHTLMLVVCVCNSLNLIVLLAQCRPITKIWDKRVEGSCWNPKVQYGFACAQGGLSTPVLLPKPPILIL